MYKVLVSNKVVAYNIFLLCGSIFSKTIFNDFDEMAKIRWISIVEIYNLRLGSIIYGRIYNLLSIIRVQCTE